MPLGEALDDDYVAEILKRDAQASSARNFAPGYEGLLTARRPTGSAPKPNTRFLRNILRDTDNHNAALLAKEAEESRARLRKLRDQRSRSGKPEQALYSARARHESGSHSPAKRRRLSDDDDDDKNRRTHRSRDEDKSKEHRSRDNKKERSGYRRRERSSSVSGSEQDHRSHRSRQRRREQRDRDRKSRRSRSPSEGRTISRERYRKRDSGSDKHRDVRRRSSRSPSVEKRAHRDERSNRDRDFGAEPRSVDTNRAHRTSSTASDSDPLESIIGPPPPPPDPAVRSRGRGAFSKSSGIDARFASDYNPSTDVQLDTAEGDDWDMALEALRDRQKWKQQGADRLRAAGFTAEEVKKWERGGERSEEDVRWRKHGEGREWDRGKVVADDGMVDVQPEWGRLKDT